MTTIIKIFLVLSYHNTAKNFRHLIDALKTVKSDDFFQLSRRVPNWIFIKEREECLWVLRFRSKLTQHTYIPIGVIQICVALSSVEVFPTNLKATTVDMACDFARMTPFSQGLFACCKVAMCSSAILFASDSRATAFRQGFFVFDKIAIPSLPALRSRLIEHYIKASCLRQIAMISYSA